MRRRTTIGAIAVIPLLIVCLIVAMFAGLFDNHVRIACAIAELAPPPPGAKILQTGGWSSGFSNQSCFAFKATQEEIDQWIGRSPSLRANTPNVLSENHNLISFDSHDEMKKWEQAHPGKMLVDYVNGPRHVREFREKGLLSELPRMQYYIMPPGGVSWFKPSITHGRMFEISKGFCCVIVDDANDVVWVAASES